MRPSPLIGSGPGNVLVVLSVLLSDGADHVTLPGLAVLTTSCVRDRDMRRSEVGQWSPNEIKRHEVEDLEDKCNAGEISDDEEGKK